HLNSRGISPLPSQANSVLTNAACRYHVVQGAFLQRLGLRTWFLDCAAYFQVPEPARSRIVRRPVSQSSLQAWRASDVSEIIDNLRNGIAGCSSIRAIASVGSP